MHWWQLLLSVTTGIAVVYAALLIGLWRYARTHPEALDARKAMRLLPDLVRLIRRLVSDPTLPRAVRLLLVLLIGYLALPFDLIPDFIPVLGYADDAIAVALVLRSVVRAAGAPALARHWPGTPAGLHLVRRLAGLAGT